MISVLRAGWAEGRPPHARGPGRLDVLLAVAIAVAAVAEALVREDLPYPVLSVVYAVVLLPAVLWRRTHPLLANVAAFGSCGVLVLVSGGAFPQLNTFAYVLLLPYAVFRWGSGREAAAGLALATGGWAAAILAQPTGPADVFGGAAVVLASAALGAAFRFRARARARELEQVTLLERERLARDLHDVVAHHVSAIAIRAQAGLATVQFHPDAATDALRVIEEEASRTLTEMRGMVRVLRRDRPAELTPAAGVADLGELAAGPGPPVDIRTTGDLQGLPSSVEAALYRLVQESVTNARRHARNATHIDVVLDAGPASVELRVSDDGDVHGMRQGGVPGYGVLGMIERASLLGGTCRAGPDATGGGWTVTAVLPRRGPGS